MSVNSKMTAIADAIRAKTGGTGLLTLDDMAQDIAAIDTSENLDEVLAEQDSIIDQIQAALEGKAGASVELGWFSVDSIMMSGSEPYKLPFLIGMTWGEWVETPLNIKVLNGGHVYTNIYVDPAGYLVFLNPAGVNAHVSVDGTEAGKVTIDDVISNEVTYSAYIDSGGGGYD